MTYTPQSNNIPKKPAVIKDTETKKITLVEAQESGLPIYTRARGLTPDIDKGFPHISEAIGVDGVIDGGNWIRFSNPCFIYNYLHQTAHHIKPGKTIPL
jgi:hypothetical protein